MIIVTGGAGFIGSQIVKKLNESGRTDIIVVDDLTEGHKFLNLQGLLIDDYIDYRDFLTQIQQSSSAYQTADVIFHQGACSVTTEWNGAYMMQVNYDYSKALVHYAIRHQIPFIYASSAAVYGTEEQFKEELINEKPVNVYGYSKWLFDQYVRRLLVQYPKQQIVGMRYFNVYGPGEAHKKNMASVLLHFNQQMLGQQKVRLFSSYAGHGPGEHRRDFIYVEDVVDVNIWFWQNQSVSGIFNVGTGESWTFNEVAAEVIRYHQRGEIEYIAFPDQLKGAYQSFTQADISLLRQVGYHADFHSIQQGAQKYLANLNQK